VLLDFISQNRGEFIRRTRDKSGLGLGLAITRKSVGMNGGDIKMEDTAKGCVFTIGLPVAS
jgi:signal transduction histidine kinase